MSQRQSLLSKGLWTLKASLRKRLTDLLSDGRNIRLDPDKAPRLELLLDALGELKADQAAFKVSLLPPGIREGDQELAEAPWREEGRAEKLGVPPDDLEVLRTSLLEESLSQKPGVTSSQLNAHAVVSRPTLSQGTEKLPSVKADL